MTIVDNEAIKQALIELIQEEPELIRNLLKEVVVSRNAPVGDEAVISDEEFDRYTAENFQRFDATFRALA